MSLVGPRELEREWFVDIGDVGGRRKKGENVERRE